MNTYLYTDKSTKKIVFSCQASGILEADKMLFKATGLNARFLPYIGCQILPE